MLIENYKIGPTLGFINFFSIKNKNNKFIKCK